MMQPPAILLAGCLVALAILPAIAQSTDSASSTTQQRLNEVSRVRRLPTMVGILFSISSDTWQPHSYTATAEGNGYGFGISVISPIRRSPQWSFAAEFTGRKYADQLLQFTSYTETVKEAGIKINLLVRYRFDKTFLRPYVGVGVYGGLGLNSGSGHKGGSAAPNPIYVGSGAIMNAGIHLSNNFLLDFRYENSSGTAGFNVMQGALIIQFDPRDP